MKGNDQVSNGPQTQRYFDRLSGQWSSNYSQKRSFRSRAERFTSALSTRVSQPAEVLDFGCGSGDISIACCAAGYTVQGVDRSPRMVEMARSKQRENVRFDTIAVNDPLQLFFSEGRFDAVITSSVLEYVDNPAQCLTELRRVCHPGAWLFCSVPNMSHWRRLMERCLKPWGRIFRPVFNQRGKDWIDYLNLSVQRYPLEVWQKLLSEAGWRCESVDGHETPLLLLHARAF